MPQINSRYTKVKQLKPLPAPKKPSPEVADFNSGGKNVGFPQKCGEMTCKESEDFPDIQCVTKTPC
jgi:hypothetical protein